ncbi:MAG: hypothetical protein ACRDTT_36240 [Pseudonocardiaceae bacterium]
MLLRDGDEVFRTYFTTARGIDRLRLDFNLLDLTSVRPARAVGGLTGRLATGPDYDLASTPRRILGVHHGTDPHRGRTRELPGTTQHQRAEYDQR